VPFIFNPALVESLKWRRKISFWHFEGISRKPISHPLMELGKTGGAGGIAFTLSIQIPCVHSHGLELYIICCLKKVQHFPLTTSGLPEKFTRKVYSIDGCAKCRFSVAAGAGSWVLFIDKHKQKS